MMHPIYEAKAREVASGMVVDDAVFCDCDCYLLSDDCRSYTPEDYDTFGDAVLAYCYSRMVGKMYWAVHLNKKHLLHVHHKVWATKSAMSCCECRRRRFESEE